MNTTRCKTEERWTNVTTEHSSPGWAAGSSQCCSGFSGSPLPSSPACLETGPGGPARARKKGRGPGSVLNRQHWQCIAEWRQWGKTSVQLRDSLSYSSESACKHLEVMFNQSLPPLFIFTPLPPPPQFTSKPDKWRNRGCSHANSWATRHLLQQEWDQASISHSRPTLGRQLLVSSLTSLPLGNGLVGIMCCYVGRLLWSSFCALQSIGSASFHWLLSLEDKTCYRWHTGLLCLVQNTLCGPSCASVAWPLPRYRAI